MRDLIQGIGENVRIPMPQASLYRGLINLRDREAWKRKDGKKQSPYDRMLELHGSVSNLGFNVSLDEPEPYEMQELLNEIDPES